MRTHMHKQKQSNNKKKKQAKTPNQTKPKPGSSQWDAVVWKQQTAAEIQATVHERGSLGVTGANSRTVEAVGLELQAPQVTEVREAWGTLLRSP